MKTVAYAILACVLALGQFLPSERGVAHAATSVKYHFYKPIIDGHHMLLMCAGTGSPTVVFESGASLDSVQWIAEMPRSGGLGGLDGPIANRFCAYDRAGEGYAGQTYGPVTKHRDMATIVRELHALLVTSGITGPYVLVGHSLGGLYVRGFAYTYPKQVVGMVQVDAVHEEGLAAEIATVGVDPAQCTDGSTFCAEASAWWTDKAEMDKLRIPLGAHSLGSMPLVVLTATQKDQPGLGQWMKWQKVLLSMSTNSRQLLDPLSQHDIPTDQPDLVDEAVQQVLAAVKHRSALPPLKDWRCGDNSGLCK